MKIKLRFLIVLLFSVALLMGCGNYDSSYDSTYDSTEQETHSTPKPTKKPEPTKAPTETPTPTPKPTNTKIPTPSPTPTEEPTPTVIVYLDEAEIEKAYGSPDNYIGEYLKVSGQIFSEPEIDEDYVYFQMYADASKGEKNTIVAYSGDNINVHSDDYVTVYGKVAGEIEGQNLMGGTITALAMYAHEVKVSSYIDVMSPSIKTIEPKLTVNQHGYEITVQKVEFSPIETRVYVKAKNGGSDKFNIFLGSAVVVQDGKQYDTQYNFDYDYEELQTDLRVGVETEGVILFPVLDTDKNLKFYIDGYCEDYETTIDEYIFDIKVN